MVSFRKLASGQESKGSSSILVGDKDILITVYSFLLMALPAAETPDVNVGL